MDLYTSSINSMGMQNNASNLHAGSQNTAQMLQQQRQVPTAARNKEEKEVLEHFSGVVS